MRRQEDLSRQIEGHCQHAEGQRDDGNPFTVAHMEHAVDGVGHVAVAEDHQIFDSLIYGTGTAREFDALIDRFSQENGFRVSKRTSGYGPSDHASFYEHGVPVLHLFTGFHKDYHRPSDDFEKLNHAGMRRIAALVTDLVVELAQADQRPKQTASDDLAELFGSSGSSSGSTKSGETRTYLGVFAAADHPDSGYLVSRVVAHGPAEKSGIQVGDVIIQFGDKKIEHHQDLVPAVRSMKPAEVVAVLVRRGTLELEMQVTLGRSR